MTYREISVDAIPTEIRRIKYLIDTFLNKCHKELPNHERVFLRRLKAEFYTSLISKFYIMPKLHKTPWKTRPVVPTCGTILHGISRWANYHLWKLIHLIPSYIKDCIDVKEKLEALGPLPPGTRLFIMDAIAMYTNIDTKHGMYILRQFLNLMKDKLPADFPVELVLEAVSLVTKNNIFEFGDCYFKQLVGEAMGAPHAAVKAIIYYAYHEITVLLKKYKRHLLYYGRFIDDGFGVWNDLDDPTAWDRFNKDVNDFGILKWEIDAPCQEVVFLDITICINNKNQIETRTYSKPQNIYQYIPQRSAHPLKVGRAIIFGKMQRFYLQNSKREDYIKQVDLLYEHMKARGWQHSFLHEWILESSKKLETRSNKPITTPKTENDTNKRRAFIHMQYHPRGIERSQVRNAFNETCNIFKGTAAEVDQITVALSRPRNLRDELISARLHQVKGKEASTYRPTLEG